MKINTIKLQDMISRVIKGAGNNKLIPLTSMLKIEVKSGELLVTTTDMTNQLTIKSKIEDTEDFYTVVNADQFSRLVSKLTCEDILLNIVDNTLQVTGNGLYVIQIQFDETTGQVVRFPEINVTPKSTYNLKLTTFKSISSVCKPALATTMEQPVYTNYYVSNSVIATDTYKINKFNAAIFNAPVLLSAELVDLLDSFVDEDITVMLGDNQLQISSASAIITGNLPFGIEEFAITPITNILEQQFNSSVIINRLNLIEALDRVSLFVGTYDNRAVRLVFSENGISIESKASNAIESVKISKNENAIPFTCLVNIDMLVEQLKALTSECVTLYYGIDTAIKFVDDNITQVISLLEE